MDLKIFYVQKFSQQWRRHCTKYKKLLVDEERPLKQYANVDLHLESHTTLHSKIYFESSHFICTDTINLGIQTRGSEWPGKAVVNKVQHDDWLVNDKFSRSVDLSSLLTWVWGVDLVPICETSHQRIFGLCWGRVRSDSYQISWFSVKLVQNVKCSVNV